MNSGHRAAHGLAEAACETSASFGQSVHGRERAGLVRAKALLGASSAMPSVRYDTPRRELLPLYEYHEAGRAP